MNDRLNERSGFELFTKEEAAEMLKVSPEWLQKRVTRNEVPHTRLGKHVRFTVDHIQAIAVQGEVKPAEYGMTYALMKKGARSAA
ncbi:helix-turn-helix domain-containing protein [Salininema proteolyticum]|uniref:Helix-turn-helix domain-containing protein n=1 Tax=Salininema proteolyticum TaxID=1607685 RepID=A0ABV8TTF7_9ACTN